MAYPANTQMVDIVVEEVVDKPPHGNVIGVVKWFNKSLGFGFITVVDTDMIGKDIFAHHSCIRPLNSNFRTLRKGEYVHFDIVDGEKGLQASNITGILGGPLMCDSVVYTPQDYKGKGSGSPRSNDDAV